MESDINHKYEGEYLNGKKWNGKQYDFDKKVFDFKLVGEYLNGILTIKNH